MSSLKEMDYRTLAALVDYLRGPGFVLDFSDRTFSQFFSAELEVDIDDPVYATHGGSKGKRLRRFLELADDATATKLLSALWEVRRDLLEGRPDPVAGSERKYFSLLERLGKLQKTGEMPKNNAVPDHQKIASLKNDLLMLSSLPPQRRGYEFEAFLTRLFNLFGLQPRASFRNRGEQIDGSFVLQGETYLLEAKWQSQLTDAKDLRDFEGKLNEKAAWARGLFVSYCGFSEGALESFGRGKKTICMDGLDLSQILERNIGLHEAVERKARRAAEDGQPFTSINHLF